MASSLFTLENSKITFTEIKKFCDQQFSEGLRIDYKREFPQNDSLAKTICAFANSAGGIILIGVEADKVKNVSTNILGIPIANGLEERVVSICLSNILPRIVPEVKFCPFKTDDGPERGVLFVRISSSYNTPHMVLQTKEIMVRLHNKNDRADLQTIEHLIELRKKIGDGSFNSSLSTSWNTRSITVEDPVFESVVIFLNFAKKDIVPFNKENDAELFKIANDVFRLEDQTPNPNHLIFEGRNPQGQIRSFCRIDGDGRLIFQRNSDVKNNELEAFESFIFLTKTLKATRKICSLLAFYGDISVGLTIVNSKYGSSKLKLGFPVMRRLLDNYNFEDGTISISRTIRYDDLGDLSETLQSMFNELCRYFHFAAESKIISEIVKECFMPSLE
jgi:hypothetical protein